MGESDASLRLPRSERCWLCPQEFLPRTPQPPRQQRLRNGGSRSSLTLGLDDLIDGLIGSPQPTPSQPPTSSPTPTKPTPTKKATPSPQPTPSDDAETAPPQSPAPPATPEAPPAAGTQPAAPQPDAPAAPQPGTPAAQPGSVTTPDQGPEQPSAGAGQAAGRGPGSGSTRGVDPWNPHRHVAGIGAGLVAGGLKPRCRGPRRQHLHEGHGRHGTGCPVPAAWLGDRPRRHVRGRRRRRRQDAEGLSAVPGRVRRSARKPRKCEFEALLRVVEVLYFDLARGRGRLVSMSHTSAESVTKTKPKNQPSSSSLSGRCSSAPRTSSAAATQPLTTSP